MAKSINQVILMGRLTRDPEFRMTTTGKGISTFSIAVDRAGLTEEVDFFEVTTWEKLAENVDKYLSKGKKVLVQGRLQLDRWEDKTTHEKRSKISIVANDVTFLDPVSEGPLTNTRALEEAGQLKAPVDIAPEDIDDKPIDLSEIPF